MIATSFSMTFEFPDNIHRPCSHTLTEALWFGEVPLPSPSPNRRAMDTPALCKLICSDEVCRRQSPSLHTHGGMPHATCCDARLCPPAPLGILATGASYDVVCWSLRSV